VRWKIKQSVDVRNCEPFRPLSDLYELVAGANLALFQHTKIESRSVVRYQQGRHPRLIRANPDAVARYARLRHLEERTAKAIPVANADLVVRQALHREVLAELPEGEIATTKRALPVSIRVDLVDHHGALLAAVTGKISLSISLEVEPLGRAASLNRMLPDAGVHSLAAPLDVLGQTDVDRKQLRHKERLTRSNHFIEAAAVEYVKHRSPL
jgi:hypothetical protein